MNVERLNRVLNDLKSLIKEDNVVQLMTNVQSYIQNSVNQPNQPAHQKNLVTTLNNLKTALRNSKYNSYPPGWKQIAHEIGTEGLLGLELMAELDDIFSRNNITPANALEEIKAINVELQSMSKSIDTSIEGLLGLRIELDELEAGECELGYTIPREFIDNNLSSLKSEIGELNFILGVISEIVTGEKQEFKVKTISSSDFLIYILIGLNVADILAKGTERILGLYKEVLEIKVLRNQLSEKGIPKAKTKSIETHANSMMTNEINALSSEIIKEHCKSEKGRKNELKNALVIAFNKLANRIDNGFDIQIRVKPLPEPEEDEELLPETSEKNDLIASIQENAQKIEYIETEGNAILELPEETET